MTKRELEEDLKPTDAGKALVNKAKSNTAKIAIVGYGRPNFATLAKMIANGEGIEIKTKGSSF